MLVIGSGDLYECLAKRFNCRSVGYREFFSKNEWEESLRGEDVVIIAGGLGDEVFYERSKESGKEVKLLKSLVRVCIDLGVKPCYISSNQVFSGSIVREYSVGDQPRPVNFYGVIKVRSEQVVLRSSKGVVLRVGDVFTKEVVRDLSECADFNADVVEYKNYVYEGDVVGALRSLIDLDVSGVVHYANEGVCNEYEFYNELSNLMKVRVNINPCQVDVGLRGYKRGSYVSLRLDNNDYLPKRHWRFALLEVIRG